MTTFTRDTGEFRSLEQEFLQVLIYKVLHKNVHPNFQGLYLKIINILKTVYFAVSNLAQQFSEKFIKFLMPIE